MTALAPHARPKIARLVAMLATDHDGEASAAVRALGRTLDRVGADFNDLAAVIEAGAMNDFVPCETWSTAMTVDAVKAPLGCGRLSNWERPYVNDIARIMYAGRGLSTAQNAKLKQIYGQRAGGAS